MTILNNMINFSAQYLWICFLALLTSIFIFSFLADILRNTIHKINRKKSKAIFVPTFLGLLSLLFGYVIVILFFATFVLFIVYCIGLFL